MWLTEDWLKIAQPVDVALLRMGVDMRQFTATDDPGVDPWAQNLCKELRAVRTKSETGKRLGGRCRPPYPV